MRDCAKRLCLELGNVGAEASYVADAEECLADLRRRGRSFMRRAWHAPGLANILRARASQLSTVGVGRQPTGRTRVARPVNRSLNAIPYLAGSLRPITDIGGRSLLPGELLPLSSLPSFGACLWQTASARF